MRKSAPSRRKSPPNSNSPSLSGKKSNSPSPSGKKSKSPPPSGKKSKSPAMESSAVPGEKPSERGKTPIVSKATSSPMALKETGLNMKNFPVKDIGMKRLSMTKNDSNLDGSTKRMKISHGEKNGEAVLEKGEEQPVLEDDNASINSNKGIDSDSDSERLQMIPQHELGVDRVPVLEVYMDRDNGGLNPNRKLGNVPRNLPSYWKMPADCEHELFKWMTEKSKRERIRLQKDGEQTVDQQRCEEFISFLKHKLATASPNCHQTACVKITNGNPTINNPEITNPKVANPKMTVPKKSNDLEKSGNPQKPKSNYKRVQAELNDRGDQSKGLDEPLGKSDVSNGDLNQSPGNGDESEKVDDPHGEIRPLDSTLGFFLHSKKQSILKPALKEDRQSRIYLSAWEYRYSMTDGQGSDSTTQSEEHPLLNLKNLFDQSKALCHSLSDDVKGILSGYESREKLRKLVDEEHADVITRCLQYIYVGQKGTQSDLHVDPIGTSAWLYLISGRKKWKVYVPKEVMRPPPFSDSSSPLFACDGSYASWRHSLLENLATGEGTHPLEDGKSLPEMHMGEFPKKWEIHTCVQMPGEVFFTPSGLLHSVVNLEDSCALTHNLVLGGERGENPLADLIVRNVAGLRKGTLQKKYLEDDVLFRGILGRLYEKVKRNSAAGSSFPPFQFVLSSPKIPGNLADAFERMVRHANVN